MENLFVLRESCRERERIYLCFVRVAARERIYFCFVKVAERERENLFVLRKSCRERERIYLCFVKAAERETEFICASWDSPRWRERARELGGGGEEGLQNFTCAPTITIKCPKRYLIRTLKIT